MKKRDPQDQYGFFYDEDGLNEVSQQIMDSYNSGTVGGIQQEEIQSEEQTELS
ncbi:hypothetical protein [Pseudoneobacillus sp. C159]